MKAKFNFFLFVLVLLCTQFCSAQSAQDCFGAIPVCQNSFSQSTSYTGSGAVSDLSPSNQGCLTTGENNSVWYVVNITTPGSFTFDVIPNSATDDYDFAVWDLTDKSCNDIMSGQAPIRCNYASLANSSAGGTTGLNNTSSSASLGASGPSYSSAITASAGQTFLILINNASASTSGYNLNFGGTASVNDNVAPTIKADTLEASCTAPTYITLLLSENIRCNTLATNGSDFSLTPASATVSGAVSQSCTNGSSFTNLIRVNFSAALPPGNYTLNVNNGTDGNTLIDNCNNPMAQSASVSFVVQPPVDVTIAAQSGCANSNSAIITAGGQFGTAPYQYRLNNGSFTSSNVFSGLAPGTYTIRVRDDNGCIDDTTITLAAPNPIVISNLQLTNPVCFGQNTGSVIITASGGNPPLQYTVNSQPYQNSNTINGLSPGNYFVRVRDANGCIQDSIIFISAPGQLSFTNINTSPATCGQNNGSVTSTGFGGTPPLQYSINNGPQQASGNFQNLTAGAQTLRITDANSCFIDTVIQIAQQNGVVITSLSLVQPTCTSNSGSVTVNTNGGLAPIQYSINGGNQQAAAVFSNLGSGTYTIVAMDANGCTDTAVAVLISPSNLFYSSATIVQPTCTSTGSISVQGGGGSPPLTYAIGTGPYSTNSNFTNLSAGTYTIHLQDANNCIHDTIITLNAIQQPSFSSVPRTQPSCSFPNGGSITVNILGGTPAFSYSINGGTPQAGNNFSPLSAGSYAITVTDANGCTLSTAVNLTAANNVAFSQFTSSDVGCFGTPLGSISTTATGGNPAYQYSLNGGTPQANGNFTNVTAGVYTVTAVDASGCSVTSSVTIANSGTVLINSVSSTNSPCFNPATGTISVTGTVSNPPIQYSITPGGNNTSGNFTGLGGGMYVVTVSDAAGCTTTSSVTITAPPAMSFTSVQIVYPPCFGGVGSISLMGQGGTPPYQYNINNGPFGASSVWNNLPNGNYTIQLQDANGCLHDTTILLDEPPELEFNGVVSVNSSCDPQQTTGSINVMATGGTPPYTYAINNGPFGATTSFTNLGAGTYIISVLDSNNCQQDTTVVISANGNFEIQTITRNQPSCFGGSDGSIVFTVNGGVAPYQYSINLGGYQASNSFSGLAAGSYNLRAIDASGCFVDTNISLSQPSAINFSTVSLNNPSCSGVPNGSVVVTGTGGTTPYNYSSNNGPFGSSANLSNLSAGVNVISIRDANNCQRDTTLTLVNPVQVGITNLSIINPGCLGGGGTVSYSGSGGSSPYSYSIDGINFVSAGLFSNLSNGSVTIYVRDGNNCTADTTFTINGTAAVTISSFSFTPYVCPGQMNGSITVTANSSNLPIQYRILGNPPQATGNFTALGAGTYTIRSEDNQGCYMDSTITIVQSPPITVDSIVSTPATCSYSNDGSLSVYASGGVQPLAYQLSGAGYSAVSTFANQNGGTYTVSVRDSTNCVVNTPATVFAPPAIVVNSIMIQQPFCSSATDGQITINVQGGVPPYQYAINTSLFTTNNSFTNLVQGNYQIQIVDAQNCQFDTTINLVANNYMQFVAVQVQDVSCPGGNDGSISLFTTGGTAPYNYSINNIPNGNSGSFSNLGIGQYSILVTDTLGCQKDTLITISQPPNALSLTQTFMTPNLCKGDSAGSIGVQASGGTTPYQYSLGGVVFQAANNFSNLPAGAYQIFASDANGCQTDSLFVVTEPDTSVQLQVPVVTRTSCIGVNDGTIRVQALYGTLPYTFFLNGVSQGTDTFYNNLAPGNYIVEVVDNIGCRSTGKYEVFLTPIRPLLLIDSLVGPFCRGDADGYLQWTTLSPYPPFDYTVNGVNQGATDFASNLGVGSYTIEVEDDRGCIDDTTVTFVESNPIELSVTTTPASCEGTGDDGGARAIVVDGEAPYRYIWSSNVGINTDSVYPVRAGTYFTIVQDNLNCTDTARFTVDYEPCCTVTLPNAFTPNGDGLNEIFKVIDYGQIKLVSFEIFNRWGNKVFRTNILTDGWDGYYKRLPAEIGSYFYVIKFKCSDGGPVEQKQGDVTLIR